MHGKSFQNDRPAVLYDSIPLDLAVSPGDTLVEWLEEKGMTQRQLATRMALSTKHINQLCRGVVALSSEVAGRLELVTGIEAKMWLRLDVDYRSTLDRLKSRRSLERDSAWLNELPLQELIDREVLPTQPEDTVSRIEQCLAFFGVASPAAWRNTWARERAAFRQATCFEIDQGAVATWLRLGELAAEDMQCTPFDARKLKAVLPQLRALTVETPEYFSKAVTAECAQVGVAVVFVREVKGCRASGATHWLSPDKAIVQLSDRYKKEDQLIFTFFHEIGHVLLHSKSGSWIDDGSEAGPEEDEANRFSADLLIPPQYADRLPTLTRIAWIESFADEIGIPAGVVVGRLQRDRIIDWKIGNKLKRSIHMPEDAG